MAEGPSCFPWEAEEVEPGHPAVCANTSPDSRHPRGAPHHVPSAIYYYRHTSETDIEGLVPDHCNKVSLRIKQVVI